jgi:outer membrane protein assembly factor BamD (BamD/ComL family)
MRTFIVFLFACNIMMYHHSNAQLNLLQSPFSNTGITLPLSLANSTPNDNMYLWCKWYGQQAIVEIDNLQSNTFRANHNRIIREICSLQLAELQVSSSEILPNVLEHKLHFQQANILFKQKNYLDAILLFKKVPTNYLTNLQIVEKNFNMAYCYLMTNQQSEVAPLMASVVNIKGNYFQSGNYYYGLLQFYNGDYEEALKSFERIQNDKEYKKVVPYYISSIYYYNKNKEEALVKSLSYLNDEKANIYFREELNLLVGQIYFDNKNFEKSIPYLEEYMAGSSTIRREDLFLLGFSNYQIGNIDKAQGMLSKVSEDLDTISQMTNYVLGDCFLKKGNKEEAKESFQKVLNIDGIAGINEISRFHYASLSYELGIDDDALNGAYNLVQKFPNSIYRDDCIKMIGNILMNTKNYKAALQIMREFSNAPEIKKAHQKIAFNQAMQEMKNKDYRYAMALLTESDSNQVDLEIVNQSDFWKGEIAYLQKNYASSLQYINMFIAKYKKAKGEINVCNAYLLKTYIGIKTGNDSLAIASLNNIYKVKNDKYLMSNAVELNNINKLLDSFIIIESKNNEIIKNAALALDNRAINMDQQMAKLDSLQNVKPYQAQKIIEEKIIWQIQKGEQLPTLESMQNRNVNKDARIYFYAIQNMLQQKNGTAANEIAAAALLPLDTNKEWHAKIVVQLFDNAIENKDSNTAKEYLAMLSNYQNLNYAKLRLPIKAKTLKNLQMGIISAKQVIKHTADTIENKQVIKTIISKTKMPDKIIVSNKEITNNKTPIAIKTKELAKEELLGNNKNKKVVAEKKEIVKEIKKEEILQKKKSATNVAEKKEILDDKKKKRIGKKEMNNKNLDSKKK